MERDRDSLDYELAGESYFAAIDARHEAEAIEVEDEDDPDYIRPETLARWARERDESTAQILAHAARIRQARAEMAAEFAELGAAEMKEVA